MAKGAQIRERWKATAKPWEQQALFNGQVARRVNRVTVDGGEGEWRDDGLYLNIFDSNPTPFAVAVSYDPDAATWVYTVTDGIAIWWSSDADNYIVMQESADASLTLPDSGQYACLYAKLTITDDSIVGLSFGVAAQGATFKAAIEQACTVANGATGTIRIKPLAIVGHLGDMYSLHRGVWDIGRES